MPATATETAPPEPYRRLWAELTNKCQLECVMCYARSGPHGSHGAMSADDWMSLVEQAAAAKINMMQFMGGEPTMHPCFTQIMSRALAAGLDVEVYSNLVHVTDEMWELFQSPRLPRLLLLRQGRGRAQRRHRAAQPQGHPPQRRESRRARHPHQGRSDRLRARARSRQRP
jgi:MoaA/NifB/PqqE/SkfB family radical SAM enzyme